MDQKNKISACIVVYNEELIIERCLKSIQGLVDEIIVVHDGECSDKTVAIAKKYTAKVFIREHVGMMEGHLVYAYEQASNEWILRIDADEYLDKNDFDTINKTIADANVTGIIFNWELWNGKKNVHFPGLQKMCLVRKSVFKYCGIPHENGTVKSGIIKKIDVTLRHQPTASNTSWKNFIKKVNRWIPVHASYFFKPSIEIHCLNTDASEWSNFAKKVRSNMGWYIFVEPVKMMFGQLKNGLFLSLYGWNAALQQLYYYHKLYWYVCRLNKK